MRLMTLLSAIPVLSRISAASTQMVAMPVYELEMVLREEGISDFVYDEGETSSACRTVRLPSPRSTEVTL